MKKETKKILLVNLGILFLFLGDRLTKGLALYYLKNQEIIFLRFFRLELYLNQGVAFSLPLYHPILYTIYFLIISFIFAFLIKAYQNKNFILQIGLTLIAVGALSNLLDRFFTQAVVDFINLRLLPIFNLADVMIVLGGALIVFKALPSDHKKTENFLQS